MKRFLCSILVLGIAISAVEASGKKGGGSGGPPGGAKVNPGAGTVKNIAPINKAIDKNVQNLGGTTQAVDKKVGDLGKNLTKKINTGAKVELQGNKTVAKLPGFKSSPKVHQQFCGKFGVPTHLHSHCFFHHDFCWNHCCWFPTFHTCGYWHPYARCWYYWYEPYCCYLPYSYIETYPPVVVTQQPQVVVNVNNSNSNVEQDVQPSLPPGASQTLPPGVNPLIPAPKQ